MKAAQIAALFLAFLGGTSGAAPVPARPPAPPAECEAKVGYDRNRVMTGYILPTKTGPRTCIPFSTVGAKPPPGYRGDFYVDEFADVKLRARWEACERDEECRERVVKKVKARQPPNREYKVTDPRHLYLLGRVAEGETDLRAVRRPAFFARAPYREPIAALENRTYTVEFLAPREPFERIHKKLTDPIRLRGWYLRGDGVPGARGRRSRALIVMTGGGGTRIAAISHPDDRLYRIDREGISHINDFPTEKSATTGQDLWRETAANFHRAGFDVLFYDRRGVGVSGGFSDTNTLQQGRDMLMMIAHLRSGEGLRALTPAGETLAGLAAARAIRGADPRLGLPVLLMGNSRGTMSSGWAMTMNFHKDCSYDEPTIVCRPPVGDRNIKGAILFAEFSSGPGYVMDRPSDEDEGRGLGRDRPLFVGGNEVENNLVFFPSSAILAGVHTWPSAFFARGLWDYAAALEGTVDSYSRVRGPKELIVVRAPHPYEVWPGIEQARARDRATRFATAVILGRRTIPGGRPWTNLKQLVATTSDVWEESTRPTIVQ
jgi:pimeloyl-ACP methyl ester carboxylesterase